MTEILCPVCGKSDQIQSVQAIVSAGTYSGTQVEELSGWQSNIGSAGGKLYLGGGPVTGTSVSYTSGQTQLARLLALPQPTQEKVEFGGGWIVLVIAGVLLGFVPGAIIYYFRYLYVEDENKKLAQTYSEQERYYRRAKPQWDKLWCCHRDNVVFVPGDGRGAASPGNMRRLIESPPTPGKALPTPVVGHAAPVPLPASKPVEIFHVMLEDAGDMPEAVIGVIAKLTGRSKDEAATLVAKAPTRVVKYEVQADADRLKDMLGAVGAEASVTSQSVVREVSPEEVVAKHIVNPANVTSGTITVTAEQTFLYFGTDMSIKKKTLPQGTVLKVMGTSTEEWFSTRVGFVRASDVVYSDDTRPAPTDPFASASAQIGQSSSGTQSTTYTISIIKISKLANEVTEVVARELRVNLNDAFEMLDSLPFSIPNLRKGKAESFKQSLEHLGAVVEIGRDY